MLPWLLGAAAVAVGAALLSDSEEEKAEKRRREREERYKSKMDEAERKLDVAMREFELKWGITYSRAKNGELPNEIVKLQSKKEALENLINSLS